MKLYKVQVLSEGVAVGTVHSSCADVSLAAKSTVEEEKENFFKAIEISLQQLDDLIAKNKENEEYLVIQRLLITDHILEKSVLEFIDAGESAVKSVHSVLQSHIMSLEESSNTYLQERVMDLADIRQRIINNITGQKDTGISKKIILYVEELHPSYLIQNKDYILAIVTKKGGFNSHGAILCRQWNIPYVVCDELDLKNGDQIIVDTPQQQVITEPQSIDLAKYQQLVIEYAKESFYAIEHGDYGFYANVSGNSEIDKVLEYGFDGIGLYRTEMIFMNTDRPYNFIEQYEIYSEAVEKMAGKVICFRTFDIGDDKQLSYIHSHKKGIDNYTCNPELFSTQIQALLSANRYGNMRIMFPMISTKEDFIFLRNWVLDIKAKMKNTLAIKIGMMLETKQALEHIEDFSDADFISVGTNDLTQEIYHIKRDMQTKILNSYLKDLVCKLKKVVCFCDANNICLSICGELAAILPAAKKFYRIGIKNLSVATPAIRVLNKVYKEEITQK